MDGTDGMAASEAIFVVCAGGLLGGDREVAAAAVVLACACLGFLRWNWPPARIFMGDVGSGYLGYAIAVLALAAASDNPVALWVWLILGGVFFVDATVTLARRLVRGERVYQAHRSHAYQWLARRWGSHLRVTLAVLIVDMVWLLPCAAFAELHPSYAGATTLIALTPLVVLAITAGSGRRETSENMHTEA
jgi:Fuc2NAc and GlcNAc transferase